MRPRRTRAQMEAEDRNIDENEQEDQPANSAIQQPSHIKRRLLNAGATPIGSPSSVNEDEEEKKVEIVPVENGSELPELLSEI